MSTTEVGKEQKPATFNLDVDPTKSLKEICDEIGVDVGNEDLRKISPWPTKLKTPDKTYSAKLTLNTGKSWEKTVTGFKDDETGGTLIEGLRLVKSSPELLDGQELLLPGSAYGLFDIVKLYKQDGKIRLGHQFVGFKASISQAILSSKR